jgi:ethanolaminephosphotransferase
MVLSESEKVQIRDFKYRGGDSSKLYEFVLSPLAQHLTFLLPEWVAPNLITLAGLSLPTVTTIITLLLNPELKAEAQPRWLS